jgi:phospholipid-translocating ATPase
LATVQVSIINIEKFSPNVVRNQKYRLITFLPIILYEQFRYFFNLYFLLVACSQLIKQLQIGNIYTYFGPLVFVLSITIFKEALDDYARFKTDKESNSQMYQKISPSGIKMIPSSDILVGDLIVIEKNQRVPADGCFLRTTDLMGTCFLRTDQLDGETDWKLKVAVQTSQKLASDAELLDEVGDIYAERPHKDIHSFVGKISWIRNDSFEDSLSVDNMLWMNTIVASDRVVVCIVYTGNDTKAVQNTSFKTTKIGLVDLEINQLSKILALVTLILSVLMVALDGFKRLWYIYVLRFLILFSNIIPISLRVNLDMGKTVYSYLIMNDSKIKDTIVRTSTIPEELGRIDYLLTDKTGTLTKNEMDLKKLHLGTMSFDSEVMDDIKAQLEIAFSDKISIDTGIFKRQMGISYRIKDIILALALCHNVTPASDDRGAITFQAASPDEIAIVKWTFTMGLKLIYRDISIIRLQYNNKTMDFKILKVFPFTSESKRMGIIIETPEKEIIFYQKGADTIMSKLVIENDWLDEECSNMAREGLRTLVIAKKPLTMDQYLEFEQKYQSSKLATFNRSELIQNCVSTYLERDLELLGLTGVEDQLQDSVKPTLELLRNAGIKIWMLTGDKIETATCIAKSSKLFSRSQTIIQLSEITQIEQALDRLDYIRAHGNCCVVIDGATLQFYLDFLSRELIDVMLLLPAVVCSRCTPTQKADIVELINTSTKKRTCAIGDGGNDVSMIQAANVGIGLVGKEGKQASLAADFSITQFSYVSRLL